MSWLPSKGKSGTLTESTLRGATSELESLRHLCLDLHKTERSFEVDQVGELEIGRNQPRVPHQIVWSLRRYTICRIPILRSPQR